MHRFIQGDDRMQPALLPHCLEDYVDEENPVRVIEVFIVELMWLTGRLASDFKNITDFRKDNGVAIRAVCGQFVGLCRRLKLFTRAVVAIDGSKFKAVNNRDKNYTAAKVTGRMEQVEASIARYLRALDRADREEGDVAAAKSSD